MFAGLDLNNGKMEMKTRVSQFQYEDPLLPIWGYLAQLGTSNSKEELVFMRIFPYSIIGEARDGYLDQPVLVMTNWNVMKDKCIN